MNQFDDIDVDFTSDRDGDGWLTIAQENLASLSGAAWYEDEPPTEDLTQEESNALRAKEMNQLSTQEREQVYYDLHGVSGVIEEEPAFVECKLTEFEEAIRRISGPHTAYERATLMSPEYVENVDFRLKFLRGDRFDAETAAKRFIAYFDLKLELFGPDKLTRDIRLADLGEDGIANVKTGFFQPLPTRDGSGRMTLVWMPGLLRNIRGSSSNYESRMRAIWYMYNSVIDDVEVQRRGFVLILYLLDYATLDRVGTWKMTKMLTGLPVRAVGIHFCYNNPILRAILDLAMLVGGQRARTHMRMHHGTHVEVQYKLSTFGVPSGVFPVNLDGEVNVQNFLEIYKMWERQEEKEMNTGLKEERIIVPGPFDVLLGRQKLAQEHQGNLSFRHIVETYRKAYENNTTRWEKTNIANKIVERVKQERKGRFLKMDGTGWVEVDDSTARDKVSHTFRNRRNAAAVKKRNKVNNSRAREMQDTSDAMTGMGVTDRDAKRLRKANGLVLSGM